jgi:hypothetical protein
MRSREEEKKKKRKEKQPNKKPHKNAPIKIARRFLWQIHATKTKEKSIKSHKKARKNFVIQKSP